MKKYNLRGLNAVVTGASSGMGRELARLLAREGVNLALAALPQEKQALETCAKELADEYGVETHPIPVDLVSEGGPAELRDRALGALPQVDILVNCAGLYVYGDFHEQPLDRQELMVQVNVTALMSLTHLFLPGMIARREGRILNFSSTAAFQPTANEAVYAATKAFVQSFSEAVRQEVRKHGVRVCTINPPTTRTPMMKGLPDLPWFRIAPVADPADMAAAAVAAIKLGRAFRIPGRRNYFLHDVLPRLSPREVNARVAYVMMRDWKKG